MCPKFKLKKMFQSSWGVYFLVFFLPLYLVRFKFGFIPINLWELMAIFFLSIWFLKKYQEKKIKRDFFEKSFLGNKGIFWSILIIFLFLFLSAVFNDNWMKSLGMIKSWFLIPLFFSFWAQKVVLPRKKENILKSYFFSATAISIIGLVYLILGEMTYDGRLTAFFNSPNYLAMFLAPSVIIGWKLAKTKKTVFYLFLGIILIALYFSFSYSAWIAITIALVIFQTKDFFREKQKNKIFIFLIFLASMMFFLFFFQLKTEKFRSSFGMEARSSFNSRITIWKASWKIIQESPFLGIGIANFQSKYLEYQKFFPPYLNWAVPHPHNIFLAFWLFGGIGALLSFVFLLFFWLKEFWRKKNEENGEIVWVVLGIMTTIIIQGFFDTTYFKNDLAVIFWLNFIF